MCGSTVYRDEYWNWLKWSREQELKYSTVHWSGAQYCRVQYSTVQYNTVLYITVQYNTIQYCTVQYNSACVNGRSSDIFRAILTRVRSFQHSSGDNVRAIRARANRKLCGSFKAYARIKRPGSTRQETWRVQNR